MRNENRKDNEWKCIKVFAYVTLFYITKYIKLINKQIIVTTIWFNNEDTFTRNEMINTHDSALRPNIF